MQIKRKHRVTRESRDWRARFELDQSQDWRARRAVVGRAAAGGVGQLQWYAVALQLRGNNEEAAGSATVSARGLQTMAAATSKRELQLVTATTSERELQLVAAAACMEELHWSRAACRR